ncbi:hypothetical protein DITRI_Ditri06bG0094400 [Diplodiscus trichospermus]
MVIRKRLDRFLANSGWIKKFSTYQVYNLISPYLDHQLILLDTEGLKKRSRRRNKRFRFEAIWVKEEVCEHVIDNVWAEHTYSIVLEKINHTSTELRKLSRKTFGKIKESIHGLKRELEEFMSKDPEDIILDRIQSIKEELNALLEKEEVFWQQRSRISWLMEGDRNTKIFHAQASQRRKQITIRGIEDERCNWCEEQVDIQDIVTDYFKKLF